MSESASTFDEHGLAEFLASGVAIMVGSCDDTGACEIARGWGARLRPSDGVVELCLGETMSGRTVKNLEQNGRVTATFMQPTTYRSVQLKGRCVAIRAPSQEDRMRVARHREAFAREVIQVGVPPELAPRLWGEEHDGLVKIAFEFDQRFNQTPGAGAGRAL
jgi:Pyridoxamine 5'-phosphate oxidase